MTTEKQRFITIILDVVRSLFGDLDIPEPTGGFNGATVPYQVQDFDSDIGIAGTSMIASASGVNIPLDEDIFRTKAGTKPLTIEESAEKLIALQSQKKGTKNGQ